MPRYRLAPESKFPAPFEDAIGIYQKITQTQRIEAVGGDSAGAQLAIATVKHTLLQNMQVPDSLFLISPPASPEPQGEAAIANRDLDIFSKGFLRYQFNIAVPDNHSQDIRLNPIADHFKGFPRTLTQFGTAEVFYDSIKQLMNQMIKDGVSVEAREYQGMFHTFTYFIGQIEESYKSIEDLALFVRDFRR